MSGIDGIDGTPGSATCTKSDSAQLIGGELARTSLMKTSTAAAIDPYADDDVCEEVGLDVPASELRGLGDEKPSPEWLWVRVQAEQAAHLSHSGLCRVRPPRPNPPAPSVEHDGFVDFDKLPYLLTPPEAARLLRTTVGAIYARVERGQMPGVVRQGRRVLFHRDAVRRVLDREGSGNVRRSK